MHIGNLRTALYGYLFAKKHDGKFILRIEDTDQQRLVADAQEVIYNALKCAGIQHDEGPDLGGNYAPYIQSQRKSIYQEYAAKLLACGAAYRCFCPKDSNPKTEEGYDRTCRNLTLRKIAAYLAEGRPFVVRQKMPLEGSTAYSDMVFGTIEVENRLLDDQILLKSDGMPTYNFANVVDDHLMAISHVMRGSEYLSSTPKYALLYSAFGWQPPLFVHLPLIMGRNDDGSTTKLSKRHGSTGFAQLVEEGYLPSAIVNYIALLGWAAKDEQEIFSMQELAQAFDLTGINKSPAIFDYQKLKWVNGEHIKRMPFEEFCAAAMPYAGLENSPLLPKWQTIAHLLHGRVHCLGDIPEMTAFLHALPPYEVSLFENKKNKSTMQSSLVALRAALTALSEAEVWEAENLHTICAALSDGLGMKFGSMAWSLRVALSGLAATPGGATDIMSILGKQESLKRIENALTKLQKNEYYAII
jgi:glutamyl-tRNA synthetase